MIKIIKSKTIIGFQIQLRFKITQHQRDEQLMRSLIEYLGCGSVHKYHDYFDFQVTKLEDIVNKIIPFFNQHSILGVKFQDFKDFYQVAEMMKEKKHLTAEGLEQIKKIKAGMNTLRKL